MYLWHEIKVETKLLDISKYPTLILVEVNAPVEVVCYIWSVIFESYCIVEIAATLKVCDDFVFYVKVVSPLLHNLWPISR